MRWELLRALGAVADSPDAARAVAGPLGLGPVSAAEHTEAFVLNCPPHARRATGDPVAGWWAARAGHTAALLSEGAASRPADMVR